MSQAGNTSVDAKSKSRNMLPKCLSWKHLVPAFDDVSIKLKADEQRRRRKKQEHKETMYFIDKGVDELEDNTVAAQEEQAYARRESDAVAREVEDLKKEMAEAKMLMAEFTAMEGEEVDASDFLEQQNAKIQRAEMARKSLQSSDSSHSFNKSFVGAKKPASSGGPTEQSGETARNSARDKNAKKKATVAERESSSAQDRGGVVTSSAKESAIRDAEMAVYKATEANRFKPRASETKATVAERESSSAQDRGGVVKSSAKKSDIDFIKWMKNKATEANRFKPRAPKT